MRNTPTAKLCRAARRSATEVAGMPLRYMGRKTRNPNCVPCSCSRVIGAVVEIRPVSRVRSMAFCRSGLE